MGYLCDFCGAQRSMVYCRSDAASLCLSCDRNIHSANSLSKRHPRTLVCERCHSQPAFVRCIQETTSLCQNCDWTGHTGCPTHKRQAIYCYTGCPSAAELSEMWTFLSDVGNSACEQGMVSMSITDDFRDGSCLGEPNHPRSSDVGKSTVGIDSVPDGLSGSSMNKVSLSEAKGTDSSFYDDFIMDEGVLSENYEQLFGSSREQLFGDDGIFGTEYVSETTQGDAYAAERSSIGGANTMKPACSNAASADSVISSKTDPDLCFTMQACTFSGNTVESSAGDHQDCGVSQMLGEPPWYSAGPESSIPSTSTIRSDAVLRYKAKKKARIFDKKVRYESRKARADVRRRVKGRFVKAGDAYDYDPLIPSRSY